MISVLVGPDMPKTTPQTKAGKTHQQQASDTDSLTSMQDLLWTNNDEKTPAE
jgi:hypothetical protein